MRGEAGLTEEVGGDALFAVGERHRPVVQPHAGIVQGRKIGAIAGEAVPAPGAMAAAGEAEHHPVAHRQAGDTLADRVDRAGAFMPEDGGQRVGHELVAKDEVRVAQTDARDLDAHLARARFLDLHSLDRERALGFAGDGGGGLHGLPRCHWAAWRQPLGVWPAYWRKARVKWLWLVKPS